MKKLFTFALALMVALAINATDYYLAGSANSWSNNNDDWKFVEVNGVLTLEVAELYGDFKIVENGAWHPQHGAAAEGEGVALNGSYNLVKCDDSKGEADAPANCKILFPQEGDWRYKNAKLTLNASDPNHLVISLVAGTLYDHSDAPKTYQIVGAFNNWNAAEAPSFEEVNGVLTIIVEDLYGSFKIIQDHAWTNQWATNWETGASLALGVPYVLGAKGDSGEPANLALANPFGRYKNAKLRLEINDNGEFVLTHVSGNFYFTQRDWFILGDWNSWKCNDISKLSPVDGQDNTYKIQLSEFSGEFKVIYGDWLVEFGSSKESDEEWDINTPMKLSLRGDNIKPAHPVLTYSNITLTLYVDYEVAKVILLITNPEEEGLIEKAVIYLDKSAEKISEESVILRLPEAPIVPGFTFAGWEVVSGHLIDGINLQAAYVYNGEATSAPAEIRVPGKSTHKLIRNGNVYILTNENTYTIQGQEVR